LRVYDGEEVMGNPGPNPAINPARGFCLCYLPMNSPANVFNNALQKTMDHVAKRYAKMDTLPTISDDRLIQDAYAKIPESLPLEGWGLEKTAQHLLNDIGPGTIPWSYSKTTMFSTLSARRSG
jgi:hypothetical protein